MKITNGDREWIHHPELTLEDIEDEYCANTCSGRGSATAAPRGYNVEHLATAVFHPQGLFYTDKDGPWHDTAVGVDGTELKIESKSCIYRYPSGGYGRFRVWLDHHCGLISYSSSLLELRRLYFFLVYTVDEDGVATEIGKLTAEATIIDEVITDWHMADHVTKDSDLVRDISWQLLLSRLGVSVEQLRKDDIVVVTD